MKILITVVLVVGLMTGIGYAQMGGTQLAEHGQGEARGGKMGGMYGKGQMGGSGGGMMMEGEHGQAAWSLAINFVMKITRSGQGGSKETGILTRVRQSR